MVSSKLESLTCGAWINDKKKQCGARGFPVVSGKLTLAAEKAAILGCSPSILIGHHQSYRLVSWRLGHITSHCRSEGVENLGKMLALS